MMTSSVTRTQSNSLPLLQRLEQAAAVANAGQKLQSQVHMTQDSLTLTSQVLGGGSAANPVIAVGDSARNLGNTLKGANELQTSLNELVGGKVPNGMLRAGQTATSSVLPFTNAAGAIADVARSQARALNDFTELQRVLADPGSTSALRIAATARATQSASDFIRKQDALLKSLDAADSALLAKNPTYAKLTQDTREMKAVRAIGKMSSTTMSRLMKAAEVGGSAAGLTLSAIALPKMVSAVGTSYQNLHTSFQDPNATEAQRLGAVADLGRATASTVHAVEGMRLSFSTLGRVATESRLLGPAATKIASTRLIRFSGTALGKAMGVLMPIADVGMFAANGVKAWQTLNDSSASFGAKARSILAVGLDGLKLATYLLPMTQGLRMAYLGASIASMSLSLWDFGHQIAPTVKKMGAAFVDAVMDPKAAMTKVANAAQEGVMTVVRGVKAAASAVWNAVTHPMESLSKARDKVEGVVEGGREVAATLGEAARFVDRKAGEGIMTLRRRFGAAPENAAPTSAAPENAPPLAVPAAAPTPMAQAPVLGGGRILGMA
ncbi:hypothetical protein D3C72_202570 [compost metagenome]